MICYIIEIGKGLENAECWFEVKTYTPDTDGHKDTDKFIPSIHTVGYHWSSDIWATASSVAKWDFLVATACQWLPKLWDRLIITPKTYPVVIHGL